MGLIQCTNELSGWRLHFCRLRSEPGNHDGVLRLAIGGALATFHGRFAAKALGDDPVVKSVRRLLAATVPDVSHEPPSSEALAKRILAGTEFPRRSAPEDLCRLLILKTLAPWSVADCAQTSPPYTFRVGRMGERYRLGDRTLDVQGWPVLVDAGHFVGSPLCGTACDVPDEVDEVLLICYHPEEVAEFVNPAAQLARLVVMTSAFRFLEEKAVVAGR